MSEQLVTFSGTAPPDADMELLLEWLSTNVRCGQCDVIISASLRDRTIEMTIVPPIEDVTYPAGPNYTPPEPGRAI